MDIDKFVDTVQNVLMDLRYEHNLVEFLNMNYPPIPEEEFDSGIPDGKIGVIYDGEIEVARDRYGNVIGAKFPRFYNTK